jgi:hypothetical protein
MRGAWTSASTGLHSATAGPSLNSRKPCIHFDEEPKNCTFCNTLHIRRFPFTDPARMRTRSYELGRAVTKAAILAPCNYRAEKLAPSGYSDEIESGPATAAFRAAQPQIRRAAMPPDMPPRFQRRFLNDDFVLLPAAEGPSRLRQR